jgi:hypothetical protein
VWVQARQEELLFTPNGQALEVMLQLVIGGNHTSAQDGACRALVAAALLRAYVHLQLDEMADRILATLCIEVLKMDCVVICDAISYVHWIKGADVVDPLIASAATCVLSAFLVTDMATELLNNIQATETPREIMVPPWKRMFTEQIAGSSGAIQALKTVASTLT